MQIHLKNLDGVYNLETQKLTATYQTITFQMDGIIKLKKKQFLQLCHTEVRKEDYINFMSNQETSTDFER